MKPHKHAELIKAWADGAEIQLKTLKGEWIDIFPDWQEECEYRIKPEPKPEPKPDVPEGLIDPKSYYQGFEDGKNSVLKPEPKPDVERMYLVGDMWTILLTHKNPQLKLTFDGETGELKSAEVLK